MGREEGLWKGGDGAEWQGGQSEGPGLQKCGTGRVAWGLSGILSCLVSEGGGGMMRDLGSQRAGKVGCFWWVREPKQKFSRGRTCSLATPFSFEERNEKDWR